MTVGITINNGLEAVLITDSRVSFGNGRQSDSVDKLKEFSKENYRGFLFGTGSGTLIQNLMDIFDVSNGETLDEFLKNAREDYNRKIEDFHKMQIENGKKDIEIKSAVFDGNKRKKFIEREKYSLLNAYEKNRNFDHLTFFMVNAYDKTHEKLRFFTFGADSFLEQHVEHQEIGSGADGAGMYLNSELQGADIKKLKPAEVLSLAANAYCYANMNQGVGGTPKIARLSRSGQKIIEQEKTLAMINLSGAYLSGMPNLSDKRIKAIFDEIIIEEKPDYVGMAELVRLNKNTLTNIYIPYNSWKESVNRKSQQ